MTLQRIKEGLSLMGIILYYNDEADEVTFCLNGVLVTLNLNASQKDTEASLFFLNLNLANWFKLVNEAIGKEKEGGFCNG